MKPAHTSITATPPINVTKSGAAERIRARSACRLPRPISARPSSKPACPAMRMAGISIEPCGSSQARRNFVCPAST